MKATVRRAWTELAEATSRRDACAKAAVADILGVFAGARPTKYGNQVRHVDGIRFASKLEANRYSELVLLRKAGDVLWFLRQVPFDVAPGVVYRADFLVVWNRSGPPAEIVTVEDTKGHLTDTSRVKIAAVEERYGIKIKLLRRGDVSR